MKKLTGLDRLIWTRTEPPLASGQFFGHHGGLIIKGTEWPGGIQLDRIVLRSGCDEMSWGRGLFIEDSNQSASGRHHSSQMSGCMTRTHARRHSSTYMLISILRLHAQKHLVLGRSTSCIYMSGCMYSFHARRQLELLGKLSLLDD
ncbi:hypothetical protein DY000_02039471 [Brassica cretica]|uniref:Uncharacterized protein n=1 Tax=Brassica cretica TaxID=69181 RepID=A0ABQ7B735_BRACR|nr:hypothetical protein DY000_02039471 [Brassica cretica]